MLFSDIIENWPELSKMGAESILSSKAYAAPCHWPTANSALRFGGVNPGAALAIHLRFGRNDAILGIPADEKTARLFPNLTALLQGEGVPEPLLLAILENDLAPLFQLLEGLSEDHLEVLGLAPKDAPQLADARVCRIVEGSREILAFLLTFTPEMAHAFGQLKYMDVQTPEIGGKELPGRLLLAKFNLQKEELSKLAQGDRLLLPECPLKAQGWKAQFIVGDRFVLPCTIADGKLTLLSVPVLWQNNDELGVIAGDPVGVTLAELQTLLQKGATVEKELTDPGHLRLCQLGQNFRKVAEGSFLPLGKENTFAVENVAE